MRIYADPARCPDCSASVTPGGHRCATCGLSLAGPLAQELFGTLQYADHLLGRMRAATSAAVSAPTVVPAAGAPALHPVLQAALRSSTQPAPALRRSSVPRILLGLGALCLLVAALVFLAVAWSVLGVGGRTAALVALTAMSGALTGWAGRAGLRGAVESLGAVTLGLGVLDVFGAWYAGWLGSPDVPTFLLLLGLLLWGSSTLATVGLARTRVGAFAIGELAAVIGVFLAGLGLATRDGAGAEADLLGAVLLSGGLAVATLVLRRRAAGSTYLLAAGGTGAVTSLFWAALFVAGVGGLGSAPTVRGAWLGLDVWSLLAAAGIGLAATAASAIPLPARLLAANAAALALSAATLAPVLDGPVTAGALALTAVVAALTSLTVALSRRWATAAALPLILGALGMLVLLLAQTAVAAVNALTVAALAWEGRFDQRIPATEDGLLGAAWLAPVLAATLAVVALVVAGRGAEQHQRSAAVRRLRVPAAAFVGTAVVVTLLLMTAPVALVLAILLSAAIGLATTALVRPVVEPSASVATGLLCAAALTLGLADETLTLITTGVTLLVAAALHLRGGARVAAVAGVALPALVAWLVWALGARIEGTSTGTALVGLLLLTALGVAHRGSSGARAPVEVGGLLAAGPLALAGLTAYEGVPGLVLGDNDVAQASWLVVYLTVVGAGLVIVALLREDRRYAAWAGGGLLALASWVRLSDLGVEVPEAYTLPTALALLVVGLWRMERDPQHSSFAALGPGLGLALVPSLLWALQDPLTLRAALLGLVCLALVLVGVARHLSAPLAFGAATGLVLVLREAAPWIGEAVPRWGLIGAAGVVLIALGVTWERRLQEARSAAGYLRDLR